MIKLNLTCFSADMETSTRLRANEVVVSVSGSCGEGRELSIRNVTKRLVEQPDYVGMLA